MIKIESVQQISVTAIRKLRNRYTNIADWAVNLQFIASNNEGEKFWCYQLLALESSVHLPGE